MVAGVGGRRAPVLTQDAAVFLLQDLRHLFALTLCNGHAVAELADQVSGNGEQYAVYGTDGRPALSLEVADYPRDVEIRFFSHFCFLSFLSGHHFGEVLPLAVALIHLVPFGRWLHAE